MRIYADRVETEVVTVDEGGPGRSLRVLVRRPRPDVPGEGGTVILEAGLGLGSAEWADVLTALDTVPEVDSWTLAAPDRAGLGGSPRAGDPRTLTQVMEDMDRVVAVVGAPGRPSVLVGHSWGGALDRLWIAANPGRVGGLVLVDASYEDGPEHHSTTALGRLTRRAEVALYACADAVAGLATGATGAVRAHARTQEMRLFEPSLDLLHRLAALGAPGLAPVCVLVTTSRTRGAQVAVQRRFASAHGLRVVAARTARHMVPTADPATLARVIAEVAAEVSAGVAPEVTAGVAPEVAASQASPVPSSS